MQKTFVYQDATLNYTDAGSGDTLVLLHGFGEDSSIWNEQVNLLKTHCRVIVPDLPGSGQSEIPQGENVSIDDYAECLNALLNEEKINSCILLGHSMGGYITLAFAKKYPEKLKGFGLVHSTAFEDSDEKKATRKQGIRMIAEHGAFVFLENTTPNLFSKNFKANHSDIVAAFIEQGRSFSNEALIQYYTAMMNRPDTTAVLKNATVPVLFVIGSEDVAAPLNDLLKQVHLPANSHIHIIEGVGHMSMMERPEELNTYVLQFVQSLSEE